MAKLFSTKTHGVLDYASVGTLLALPRMLGWSSSATSLVTNSALATLGASLLTRYELGVIKVLPMRGHLALDAMNGLLLAAAPLLLPDEDSSTKALLVGCGVFELLAAFSTETEPTYREPLAEFAVPMQDNMHLAPTDLHERAIGA